MEGSGHGSFQVSLDLQSINPLGGTELRHEKIRIVDVFAEI
jgi:hypothetical protein